MSALLDTVKNDNRRAADIILRLRKLFQGGDRVREIFDITELIEDCVALLAVKAEKEGIVIHTRLPTSVLLNSDRTQVQQVILNLLTNAIEAVTAADKPEKSIRVSTAVEAGQLKISVEDNGIGIGDEQRGSLFELFKTSKSAGMGVGLWLSRALVSAHGGTIDVSENAGESTCFEVILPIATDARDLALRA